MDAPQKLKEVPVGLAHLGFISSVSKSNHKSSEPILRKYEKQLSVLGIAMAGLYTSATCHRGCRSEDHIIEVLGARVYNLAYGSYSLISIGLYDEALNLVRSIGEIANLLSLRMFEEDKFDEWVKSNKADRIRNFGPAKVRKLLEKNGIVIMSQDWYGGLCEAYTHVTPDTAPNKYDINKNVCGGIVQPEGARVAINQLTEIVAMVSLYYCRYSDLMDLFDRLWSEFRELETS